MTRKMLQTGLQKLVKVGLYTMVCFEGKSNNENAGSRLIVEARAKAWLGGIY